MSWFNAELFCRWQDHGGTLTSAPTACSLGNARTDIFVRGADYKAWQAYRDDHHKLSWVNPITQVPDGHTKSSISAVASPTQWINLFAVGSMSGIYWKSWNGHAWTAWQDLKKPYSTSFATAPSAFAYSAGNMDIFCVGNDQQLWKKQIINNEVYNPPGPEAAMNAGWVAWGIPKGGNTSHYLNEAPAVGRIGTQLNILLVDADGKFWRKCWGGGPTAMRISAYNNFNAYEGPEGIRFRGTPAIARLGTHLWVFCIGNDNNIYHGQFNEYYPMTVAWSRLAMPMHEGIVPKTISATNFEVDNLGVVSLFVQGSDDRLWELMLPANNDAW